MGNQGKYVHKHRPSEAFIKSQCKSDEYYESQVALYKEKDDYEYLGWYRSDSHIYIRFKHKLCGQESKARFDKWKKNEIKCVTCSYNIRGKNRTNNATDKYYIKAEECYKKYVNADVFDFSGYEYSQRNLYVILTHKICGGQCRARVSDIVRGMRINCNTCTPAYSSIIENDLLQYVRDLGFDAYKLEKGTINSYEYDIYVPSKSMAFEYNGTYWHSSKFSRITSVFHKNKVEEALKSGIKVYNLWEYWGLDMCKSIISSKLGCDKKIPARKCSVQEISTEEAKKFIDENHFEGYDASKIKLGLFYNNDLVACMTFKSTGQWELSRFCCKKYVSVVGGFSKLLSFYKKNYNYPFVTWGYRDICPDPINFVYNKVGLKLERYNPTILRYYNHNKNIVENRRKYQRKNQEKLFPDTFSWDLSERENLEKQRIYAIWDTGCYKFVYEPDRHVEE